MTAEPFRPVQVPSIELFEGFGGLSEPGSSLLPFASDVAVGLRSGLFVRHMGGIKDMLYRITLRQESVHTGRWG